MEPWPDGAGSASGDDLANVSRDESEALVEGHGGFHPLEYL